MNSQKSQNILNLSSEERYGYLIRQIADTEEIWIIRDQNDLVTLGDKNSAYVVRCNSRDVRR